MKALRFDNTTGFGLIELDDLPSPPAGHVKIVVSHNGLCGTDDLLFRGKHPTASNPVVPGHEASGTIIEAGDGVDLEPGTVVAIFPYNECGECGPCLEGRTNCCDRLDVIGVHSDGALCQQLIVPENKVYPVPELKEQTAPLIEVLGVAAHALRRAGLLGGPRHKRPTLVIGSGPIGRSIAMLLRNEGHKFTLIDKDQQRVTSAEDLFGIPLVGPREVLLADGAQLTSDTTGAQFDCIFDATGDHLSVKNGLASMLAPGGKFISVGILTAMDPVNFAEGHRKEQTFFFPPNATAADYILAALGADAPPGHHTLIFSRNANPQDWAYAIDFASADPRIGDMLQSMITKVVKLEDAAEELSAWVDNKDGQFKVMVRMG